MIKSFELRPAKGTDISENNNGRRKQYRATIII